MLLPQTKEREYRFKLALRIGLPIFALILAFIFHTLINSYTNLQNSFFIEAALLLVISIYFILYLIYKGFDVKITDDVTKTFTREYLYSFLKKEINNHPDYTLILISVDNLNDINTQYGIKNGDRVLREVVQWLEEYFEKNGIEGYPIGHIKGGDFVIGLKGKKEDFITFLDLMCLKAGEFKVDDIEVKISGAITDTTYSKDLDYLIENLFELQEHVRESKESLKQTEEIVDPNELEASVISAIQDENFLLTGQKAYSQEEEFTEIFVKLKSKNGKHIFPKTFVKVINKLGLGVEFDIMILQQVVTLFQNGESVAINIHPTSLRNEKFLSRAKEILQGREDISLIFILYEMEYFPHIARFNALIRSLKGYNIRIALDRIGSIHTSFLYLRELEVDIIRFDTYYAHYDKLIHNKNIIEGFNIMAHKKGIKSWIKNIEDEESYRILKELNIDFLQGRYLSDVEKIYEKEE